MGAGFGDQHAAAGLERVDGLGARHESADVPFGGSVWGFLYIYLILTLG